MLVVQALQRHGANLSVRDRWGNTPLSESIREGHLEVARFLIKNDAELGMTEEDAAGLLCDLARGGAVGVFRSDVVRRIADEDLDPCD